MNTSKHTPGPWKWIGSKQYPKARLYLSTPQGYARWESEKNAEETANARLIAAAPDVVMALERVPIPRLGETPESFIERFKEWYREERNPALALLE